MEATRSTTTAPGAGTRRVRAELRGDYREDAPYPSAMVNVTNKCNLRCRHCFVFREGNPNHAPDSIRDELADDAILETLEALRDRHGIRSMMWMGGEPLLKRSLIERGIRLFEHNSITTNGTIPLPDLGPDVLYVVSLDGPEDVNDAIRGQGGFRRVLRNLERLPRDFSSRVQAQCVVTRSNQDRIAELVEALQGSRIGWMTFSFYVPRSGDFGADAWRDNAERMEAIERVRELKRRHPSFVRNSGASLDLMHPEQAGAVTRSCPAKELILPLYLEGDHFATPYCCYGNDVDCERCGAWAVFHIAARRGAPAGGEQAQRL